MFKKFVLLHWLILPILTLVLGFNLGKKHMTYILQKDAEPSYVRGENNKEMVKGVSIVKSEKVTILPTPSPKIQPTNSVWVEVNQYRKDRNLLELNWDQDLCEFAGQRLANIVSSNSLHHNGFSEMTNEYMQQKGYLQIGENLSQGFTESKKIVEEWGKSSTHKILLETSDLNRGCVVEKNSFVVFIGGSR